MEIIRYGRVFSRFRRFGRGGYRRYGFTSRVKNVVKKMHALQTLQYPIFLDPIITQNTSGGSQNAFTRYYTPDDPNDIRNYFPGAAADEEIFIKRLYEQLLFTNTGVYPVYVQYAYLRARNDTTSAINVIIAQDAPAVNQPYVSFTTGHDLQKQFKIIKSNSFFMRPAKTYKFKVKSIYANSNKPITKDVEGSTNYQHKRGNTILVLRFMGVPIGYLNSGDTARNTCLGPMNIRGVSNTYISYHTMSSKTTTSGMVGSGIGGSLLAGNPLASSVIASTALPYNDNYGPHPMRVETTALTP